MKKTLLSLFIATAVGLPALSAPADKTPMTVIQPDGRQLTVTLAGDEHAHYFVTADGLPVLRDNAGCFRYVTAYDGTREVLSSVPACDASQRTAYEQKLAATLLDAGMARQTAAQQQARRVKRLARQAVDKAPAFPNTGEVRGLVILVEFNDRAFIDGNDRDTFDRMLNEAGYSGDSYGSAYDYFTAQSHGQFSPHFDVYGPVKLSNDYSFYGRNSYYGGDDINAHIMVNEACTLLDDEIDYSQYDYNDDGLVDLVFVLYAGYGENSGADSNTVWPHASDLRYYFDQPVIKDGKQLASYACSCELRGNEHNSFVQTAGIGVFCHEFSHCLGLMDLYDTNGTNGGNGRGFGSYSIMDAGCYNNSGYTPCSYTAYERSVIGWLTPTELGDEYHANLTLQDINESNEAYAIYNPNDRNEFFIFENRQLTGWDNALPGKGMMISHINYNAEDWEMNLVNSYYEEEGALIVPANNNYSSLTEASQLYPTSSNNAFTDTSTPAAQFRDGSYVGHPVTDIRDVNGVISFTYDEMSLIRPTALPATDVTNDAFTANWDAVANADTYTLTVTDCGAGESTGGSISEDFSGFTSGAEDSPSNSDISSHLDEYMTDEGWRGSKVYQAGGKCKLGSSTSAGYLVSPELQLPAVFTISVDAKDYVTSSGRADGTTLYIGVGEKTPTGEGGEWLAYEEFPLTAETETYTLRCDAGGRALCFEIGTVQKRAIIDNIRANGTSAQAPAMTMSETYSGITGTQYRVTGLDRTHTYSYTVRAIAGGIESEESNVITVTMASSVDEGHGTVANIITGEGYMTISSDTESQVSVHTIDGIRIFCGKVSGQRSLRLDNGIYIVTIGSKSQKVLVR